MKVHVTDENHLSIEYDPVCLLAEFSRSSSQDHWLDILVSTGSDCALTRLEGEDYDRLRDWFRRLEQE